MCVCRGWGGGGGGGGGGEAGRGRGGGEERERALSWLLVGCSPQAVSLVFYVHIYDATARPRMLSLMCTTFAVKGMLVGAPPDYTLSCFSSIDFGRCLTGWLYTLFNYTTDGLHALPSFTLRRRYFT